MITQSKSQMTPNISVTINFSTTMPCTSMLRIRYSIEFKHEKLNIPFDKNSFGVFLIFLTSLLVKKLLLSYYAFLFKAYNFQK